ncbi:hypothetical protein [Bradyrhizobium sp. CCGB20]|uniref:hypothetical protein n=1 Tax=Bradyrhizobium sp. CCGB20 TaxID=2949633 RepID=UPI0020B3C0E4|nr:hypothetical protein [Bradyrhizobium sp. CCGB20]MCP3400385.1 hypothetical protein [Bradyrhizobium sp. CCGB20]
MTRRVFISPKSARRAGRKACEGRALRFKVEPHFVFNRDGSVDQGFVVSLWSHIGILHKGFVRQ